MWRHQCELQQCPNVKLTSSSSLVPRHLQTDYSAPSFKSNLEYKEADPFNAHSQYSLKQRSACCVSCVKLTILSPQKPDPPEPTWSAPKPRGWWGNVSAGDISWLKVFKCIHCSCVWDVLHKMSAYLTLGLCCTCTLTGFKYTLCFGVDSQECKQNQRYLRQSLHP